MAIVGESINPEILEGIDIRQRMHGAGYNSASIKRDPKVLNYLNNRNAWIKMASGVNINFANGGDKKVKAVFDQSGDITWTDAEVANLNGTGLAKQLVLFNTVQSFNNNSYQARSGYRKDNLLNNSIDKMYGGLGGNSQGLKPVGGIVDMSVENINRGSIRKATVNIKVYNKFQFSLIELLYLRLGYIMILEWGWDKYAESIVDIEGAEPIVNIMDMGPTIIEKDWFTDSDVTQRSMLRKIENERIKTKGNYDAFFGKVSNFSWTANTDGSYDIKVDLITLGSVIESIQVSVPAKPVLESTVKENQENLQELLDDDVAVDQSTGIVANLGSDAISQFLGNTILNFPTKNTNSDYIELKSLSQLSRGRYNNDIPPKDNYFIRLGEFLQEIQKFIISEVKNGDDKLDPVLNLDTGVLSNQCNYVTNLIPLDPTKCIFTFNFSDDIENAVFYPPEFKASKIFDAFAVEDEGVTWGQTMNIYMNMNFLGDALTKNIDVDGKLSLNSYLTAICDGINTCTGNTTNLEPAIRDDKTVYFLEKNPIKGRDALTPKQTSKPIEIMGYNSNGTSNFLHNFSFNTDITPDLMAMISIGATANGEAASIPFNNWNSGLENRFQKVLLLPEEPSVVTQLNGLTSPAQIRAKFTAAVLADGSDIDWDLGTGYDWEWKGKNINDIDGGNVGWRSSKEEDAVDPGLLDEVVKAVHALEKKQKKEFGNSRVVERDPELRNSNTIPFGEEYLQYLVTGFGGDTGTITTSYWGGFNKIEVDTDDAIWWDGSFNPGHIKRGKESFKSYINFLNTKEFKESGVLSSTGGFIPVNLKLEFEGLSGIKIYDKIEINQNFLPPSYPTALKFVVMGVNHSVGGNMWTSDLKTISTSITDQKPTVLPNTSVKAKYDYTEVKGPIAPRDSTSRLLITDNRTVANKQFNPATYGKLQSKTWLVNEMNQYVRAPFLKFLNVLEEKYPGYTLVINATYRTFKRSIELKKQNPKNASAGKSPHNYAYALDMNVIDPNGVVYKKRNPTPWIQSGIPDIAVESGLRWGGSFQNYVDCVHFDATNVTAKSISNAAAENEGILQKDWDTRNINYV